MTNSTLSARRSAEQPVLLRFGHGTRFMFAVGAVGLALGVTLAVPPLWEQPPTILFFAAVILSSWYGGLMAGLAASLLSILALDYFFVEPFYALRIELLGLVDFVAFAGATWLISTLQARWRNTHRTLVTLEQELDLARRIQQRFFPAGDPSEPGLDVAGVCFPAGSTGGDLFDYVPMADGRLGLAVGDVCGHGLGPALVMALVHAYLRALALTCADPGEILSKLNRLVCEETDDNLFVTVFLGQLDRETRTFRYAGAGHEAYLLEASGEATRLVSTGLPLGVGKGVPIPCAPLIKLQAGQLLLLLSDGIVEAEGADGRQFGLERALQVVRAAHHRPSCEIVTALHRAAREHARHAPQLDDMTVVLVKFM